MDRHDTDHSGGRWELAFVRRTGLGHLTDELIGQRARTVRAQVRGRTMVNLADVLGRTGTGAEITVAENDGSQWSMTVWPHRTEEDMTT